MQNLSDYELMQLVKQKRQEALSVLYDRYASLVYSFAWRATKNEPAVREIVQSVFVRLWTTESTFDPDKGQFTSWLITITRNLTADWLRKQRRQSAGVVSYIPQDDRVVSPEDQADLKALREQIRSAFRFLSKAQIDLLEHFYWQGYSLSELSAYYREPIGTVKNRLHQTLKILRRHLSVEGRDGNGGKDAL